MILRKPPAPARHQTDIALLSQTGGLTQIGIYLQTLAPGASTGEGHWHSAEDEFLYVTEGIATVIDDDGAHDLHPGDAAVWRAGVPNPHHVTNRTDAPCRYIIAGSRIARDICTYPASGRRQINADTTWEILDRDGNRLKGGDLPAELLNLTSDWTTPPAPGDVFRRIVRQGMPEIASPSPQDTDADTVETHLYSKAGGLQQFTAVTETLPPGSSSPQHHWHKAGDRFLLVLDGEVTVSDAEGAHVLHTGDVACWPAGIACLHCTNHSAKPSTALAISTRWPSDKA
jgi:uncharacterized cupin superfamily protein